MQLTRQSQMVSAARWWHIGTAVIATFGLVLQLILVISGAATLLPEQQPGLVERLVRMFSYFTIQSNIWVLIMALMLARRPDRDGAIWRALRLDSILGIAVTGLVHWFFLRPLLDLDGWSYLADKVLHIVVPLTAVIGWLLFGPRIRVGLRSILGCLIWPVAWLIYTMVVGAITSWYPYPFLDAGQLGYPRVALNSVGITALLLGLALLARWGDRALPRTVA